MNTFRITKWDEKLDSYVLSDPDKYNNLNEQDLINYIGSLENYIEEDHYRIWDNLNLIAKTIVNNRSKEDAAN